MKWPFSRKSATAKIEERRAGDTHETFVSFFRPRWQPINQPHLVSPMQQQSTRSHTATLRFAFQLFAQLTKNAESGNLFFSPVSIMMCLGMATEIASGETQHEIMKAIEMAELDPKEQEIVFGLLKWVFRARPDVTLLVGNSLWCSNRARILPECAARIQERYNAEFATVDFSRSDAVIAQMNAWVNHRTKGKIDRVTDHVSPLTALIGVNAIYFKGLWSKPFDRRFTGNGVFTTAAGVKKQLPMMRQLGTFNYYEDDKVQMVELPYGKGPVGEETAMCIVLPAEGMNYQKFQGTLSVDSWRTWVSGYVSVEGTIELPRFKVDYRVKLNSVLKALGMERAFDPNQAEFGGIQTAGPMVWVNEVLHQALAEVNEEGTEAIALTAMTETLGRAPRRFRMIVDRPFFVVIRDRSTGAILFMGLIGDPH